MADRWKQPKSPSTDKMWSVHTMENDSAVKWNEVLMDATVKGSQKTLLSERIGIQGQHSVIPLRELSRVGNSVQQNQVVGARARGRREWAAAV